MKILHIAKYSIGYSGGIEKIVRDICSELVKKGNQVSVLAFGNANRNYKSEGIELFEIKADLTISYAPLSLKYFKIFKKIIQDFKPEIIHIHMPNVMPMFLNLKNTGAKVFVHWHSDVFFTKNDFLLSFLYNFYRIFENRLLKYADKIIATSQQYADHSNVLKMYKKKLKIIPLGISLLPQRHITYEDFFLTIGRFTYYKGFEYLIEAMRLSDNQVKLVMAGSGQVFEKIQKKVVDYNLTNRVVMLGEITEDKKIQLLSKCRFFCLPSIERTEAFGISLLEAMQYKKALLTTNIKGSGVNFVNIHEKTGLVSDVCNPKSLKENIEKLYFDIDSCKKMGESSYQRFISNFKIEKMVSDLYSDIYLNDSQIK